MNSRLRALAVVLCVLVTTLAATSSALAARPGATSPKRSAGSLLFVQETKAGELVRVRPGVYRLVFRDASPTVATFTDRPYRHAGAQDLGRFVHGWAADGFAGDPPNAALVIHGAPSSRDVAMLTLSHPRYDGGARRLTYTAKPLHGTTAKSLAGFSRRGDPLRSLRFGDASLFIDDSGEATVVPVLLQVTVDTPMQEMAKLAIASPSSAVWSLGRPESRTAGLEVITPGGVSPLSYLVVSPTEINLRAASQSGGPVSFVLNLDLECEASAEALQLITQIGPGIQVEATVNGLTMRWNSGNIAVPLFE